MFFFLRKAGTGEVWLTEAWQGCKIEGAAAGCMQDYAPSGCLIRLCELAVVAQRMYGVRTEYLVSVSYSVALQSGPVSVNRDVCTWQGLCSPRG